MNSKKLTHVAFRFDRNSILRFNRKKSFAKTGVNIRLKSDRKKKNSYFWKNYFESNFDFHKIKSQNADFIKPNYKFNSAKIALAAVAPIPTALLMVGATGFATSPTAKIPAALVRQRLSIFM